MLMLRNSWNKRLIKKHPLLAGAFLLLVILGAKIDLDLGGIVSFTLQTLFLGLAYCYLPRSWKFVLIAGYLLLGIAGVPVFNGGAGWDYFSSWPLGFFVGFVLAAMIPSPESSEFLPAARFFIQIHVVIILAGVSGIVWHSGSCLMALETAVEILPGAVLKTLTGAGVVAVLKVPRSS
jgi:biotin transporter BioY